MKIDKEGIWLWQRKESKDEIFILKILRNPNTNILFVNSAYGDETIEIYEKCGNFISWFHHDSNLSKEAINKYKLQNMFKKVTNLIK